MYCRMAVQENVVSEFKRKIMTIIIGNLNEQKGLKTRQKIGGRWIRRYPL